MSTWKELLKDKFDLNEIDFIEEVDETEEARLGYIMYSVLDNGHFVGYREVCGYPYEQYDLYLLDSQKEYIKYLTTEVA